MFLIWNTTGDLSSDLPKVIELQRYRLPHFHLGFKILLFAFWNHVLLNYSQYRLRSINVLPLLRLCMIAQQLELVRQFIDFWLDERHAISVDILAQVHLVSAMGAVTLQVPQPSSLRPQAYGQHTVVRQIYLLIQPIRFIHSFM